MLSFIDSLFSLSPVNLRYLNALFIETSPSNLIKDTVTDLAAGLRGVQKAQDAFLQRLARTAKARQEWALEALVFDFLLDLADALELEQLELSSEEGLADFSRRIEEKAMALYRTNNTRFAGSTTEEYYTAQMIELLDDMRIAYIGMPDEQQQSVVQQILGYLTTLPAEQQERVCKALDCTSLTTDILHGAMLRRILVRVFLEEIGIHSLVGKQSALLSDSFVLAAVLGEEGKKLIRTQNRQLQQRVLPILIALTLLGESEPRPVEPVRTAVIARWRDLFSNYRKEEKWAAKVSYDLQRADDKLEDLKAKKKALEGDLREENNRYGQVVKLVAEHLATARDFIEELAEQGPLAVQAQQYLDLDDKTAERELQKRQEQAAEIAKKRGFLEKTWARMKNLGESVVKVKDQRAMSNMLQNLAQDLLNVTLQQEPEWLTPFKTQAIALQTGVNNLQQQIKLTQIELDKVERLRNELQASVNASRERLKAMSKQYPALAKGIPGPEDIEPTVAPGDAADTVGDAGTTADEAADAAQPTTAPDGGEPVQIDAAQEEYPQVVTPAQTAARPQPTAETSTTEETIHDHPGEICG